MRMVFALALSTALLAAVVPMQPEYEDNSIDSEVTERIDNRARSRDEFNYSSDSELSDIDLGTHQHGLQRTSSSVSSAIVNPSIPEDIFHENFHAPPVLTDIQPAQSSWTSMDGLRQRFALMSARKPVSAPTGNHRWPIDEDDSSSDSEFGVPVEVNTDNSDEVSTTSIDTAIAGDHPVSRIGAVTNGISTGIRNLASGIGRIRPVSGESPRASERAGIWRDTEDLRGGLNNPDGTPPTPPSSLGRLGNTARYHFTDPSSERNSSAGLRRTLNTVRSRYSPSAPRVSLGRMGNTARYHFNNSSKDPFPPNTLDFS